VDHEDYRQAEIRFYLHHYNELSEGHMPLRKPTDPSSYTAFWGAKLGKHYMPIAARFETPIQLKVDIDRAIQRLTPTEQLVILACSIDQRSFSECAYWLDKADGDVAIIQERAVARMARFLSKHAPQS